MLLFLNAAFGSENEIEQLGTSVDFLVEFTDNILVKARRFYLDILI